MGQLLSTGGASHVAGDQSGNISMVSPVHSILVRPYILKCARSPPTFQSNVPPATRCLVLALKSISSQLLCVGVMVRVVKRATIVVIVTAGTVVTAGIVKVAVAEPWYRSFAMVLEECT